MIRIAALPRDWGFSVLLPPEERRRDLDLPGRELGRGATTRSYSHASETLIWVLSSVLESCCRHACDVEREDRFGEETIRRFALPAESAAADWTATETIAKLCNRPMIEFWRMYGFLHLPPERITSVDLRLWGGEGRGFLFRTGLSIPGHPRHAASFGLLPEEQP